MIDKQRQQTGQDEDEVVTMVPDDDKYYVSEKFRGRERLAVKVNK